MRVPNQTRITVQVRAVGKVALLYPLFKMARGIVCGVLAFEHYVYYGGQAPGSVKALYLWDLTVWLLAALVLMSEGLREYVALVDELLRRG